MQRSEETLRFGSQSRLHVRGEWWWREGLSLGLLGLYVHGHRGHRKRRRRAFGEVARLEIKLSGLNDVWITCTHQLMHTVHHIPHFAFVSCLTRSSDEKLVQILQTHAITHRCAFRGQVTEIREFKTMQGMQCLLLLGTLLWTTSILMRQGSEMSATYLLYSLQKTALVAETVGGMGLIDLRTMPLRKETIEG